MLKHGLAFGRAYVDSEGEEMTIEAQFRQLEEIASDLLQAKIPDINARQNTFSKFRSTAS